MGAAPSGIADRSTPRLTSPSGRRLRDRWWRWPLVGAIAIGVLLGVQESFGRIGGLDRATVTSPTKIIVVAGLLVTGQAIIGYGWRRLLPAITDPVTSMWTFHATQPGKYLPLGIGQAVGQVALVRDLGVPLRSAVASWASHVAMLVVGGCAVGALLVVPPGTGTLRWVFLAGLLAVAVAHRSVLGVAIGAGARLTSRLPAPSDLPGQRALIDALAASIAFMLLHGLGYAVLVDGWEPTWTRLLSLIGAYALSAGLSTATPLPAGLGAREALLVLLSGLNAPTAIAAAVAHRVIAFGAEIALLGLFVALRALRRHRTDGQPPVA